MITSFPEHNVAAAAQSTSCDSGFTAEKTALAGVNPSKPKIDIAPDQLRDMLLDSLAEALKEHNKYHDPKAFSRHTKSLVSKML